MSGSCTPAIVSGEPPVILHVDESVPLIVTTQSEVVIHVDPVSSVVVTPPSSTVVHETATTLHFTQEPGVGPPGADGAPGATGPQGPAGPSGSGDGGEPLLVVHIADETPHPPYDDQPSLVLLFENRLV